MYSVVFLFIFQLDQHIEDVCPRTKMMCQYEEIGCAHRVSSNLTLSEVTNRILKQTDSVIVGTVLCLVSLSVWIVFLSAGTGVPCLARIHQPD